MGLLVASMSYYHASLVPGILGFRLVDPLGGGCGLLHDGVGRNLRRVLCGADERTAAAPWARSDECGTLNCRAEL